MTLPNGQRNLTYADWDGFYVRCVDESNPDWPVQNDIVKELLVKPFGKLQCRHKLLLSMRSVSHPTSGCVFQAHRTGTKQTNKTEMQ